MLCFSHETVVVLGFIITWFQFRMRTKIFADCINISLLPPSIFSYPVSWINETNMLLCLWASGLEDDKIIKTSSIEMMVTFIQAWDNLKIFVSLALTSAQLFASISYGSELVYWFMWGIQSWINHSPWFTVWFIGRLQQDNNTYPTIKIKMSYDMFKDRGQFIPNEDLGKIFMEKQTLK